MKNRVRIDVLFLTALLALRVLIVPVLFLDFELRRDYIARYLCENRNRPELHCDGQCYLAKRLQAAQEQEQQQKGQELLRFLFELPFEAGVEPVAFAPVFSEKTAPFPACAAPVTDGLTTAPFHPPRA